MLLSEGAVLCCAGEHCIELNCFYSNCIIVVEKLCVCVRSRARTCVHVRVCVCVCV